MVIFLVVGLIGGLVGAAELISRYRDAPTAAIRTVPAIAYIAVNAAASLGALVVIRAFDWNFGQPDGSDAAAVMRTLVAGFGAVALFRTSLFLVRIGDADVGVGPSTFLQILLSSADRAVDRKRAGSRATVVAQLMRGVDFDKAFTALPTYCLALLQNVPDDEQESLANDMRELAQAQMSADIKVFNLGLRLMNVVGPMTLKAAVDSLGSAITVSDAAVPTPAVAAEPAGSAELQVPPIPPAPPPDPAAPAGP